MEIRGTGEAYWETGTEGVYWAVHDANEQKFAYDRLFLLQDGDQLTIFDKSNANAVCWQGTVDLEYESHQEQSALNRNYRAQAVFNHWVWGLQRKLDAETWATYFFEGYPMRVVRRAGWDAYHYDGSTNEFHRAELHRVPERREDEQILLSLKYGLAPAHGRHQRYLYRQDKFVAMHLSREDVAALRDACIALLAKCSDGFSEESSNKG